MGEKQGQFLRACIGGQDSPWGRVKRFKGMAHDCGQKRDRIRTLHIAAALAIVSPLFRQIDNGKITGCVTDRSGAALA